MRARFAFELDDLASLLTLDVTEPGDVADIDTIYEILLRRGTPGTAAPTGPDQEQERVDPRRPRLHLVPDHPR